MQQEILLPPLTALFREVFADESLEITASTTIDDIEGWDSLTHMTLISELEEKFAVRFSLDEVMQIENVGQLLDLLSRKKAL